MKNHKNWSIAATACMIAACLSGYNSKLRKTHKYWALGASACLAMSLYSGHKIVHKKKKRISSVEKAVDGDN